MRTFTLDPEATLLKATAAPTFMPMWPLDGTVKTTMALTNGLEVIKMALLRWLTRTRLILIVSIPDALYCYSDAALAKETV